MGRECRMNGEKRNQYWWERQKERENWKKEDVCGLIILGWILKIGLVGMDWIDLAQDTD
jgi:hypothetical protein